MSSSATRVLRATKEAAATTRDVRARVVVGRDDEGRAGESCGGFENEGGVEKDL